MNEIEPSKVNAGDHLPMPASDDDNLASKHEKMQMLMFFDSVERQGIRLPKRFTMQSEIDEMRWWHLKLMRDVKLVENAEQELMLMFRIGRTMYEIVTMPIKPSAQEEQK